MPGIIDKIIDSGSENPEKYMKRVDRNRWVSGGYHVQASPFELAQAISAIRAYAAPRSMLCAGVDSAGAERFMAEELGILSIRFLEGSEHPAFARNGEGLQSAGIVKATCKTFDLVTVRGENAVADFETCKPFLRDGTVVVVFDTSFDNGVKAAKEVWFAHRRVQMSILHTHDVGIGVFVVKNLAAMGVTSVRADVQKPIVEESKEAAPTPPESAGVSSEVPEGRGDPNVNAPQTPPKRRGRPPRVKV